MKATVVGVAVPAKTLRAACTKAEVPGKDVRVIGTRTWVAVPDETRDAMLARLAEVLGTGLMVVDVDLPSGASDDGLQASRATYRGVEEDVTAEARELLHKRLADGHALDPDAAARDLAWAIVGDRDGGAVPADGNAEEQWAHSLLDRLVAEGSIELHGEGTPVAAVASVLQSPGRDLGDRLLAELIDSTAVDEVFADADQLATLARATKPKR
jgi:hypothetical protein